MKAYVYSGPRSVDVCGRLPASSQEPCEEVVRPCRSTQICAAEEMSVVMLAVEKKMVRYRQSRLVESAFSFRKNVANDEKGWEGGGRVVVALTESMKVRAARRPLTEQNSTSLLRLLCLGRRLLTFT